MYHRIYRLIQFIAVDFYTILIKYYLDSIMEKILLLFIYLYTDISMTLDFIKVLPPFTLLV